MDQLQQTVTDILVENIRNEIIQGTFAPGERLQLRDLAKKYNVSTMPVREALRELEAEGIVSSEPRKGAFVTLLSVEDLEDIYEIRATLEAMAIRLAVPNLSDDTLIDLSSIVNQMDQNMDNVAQLVQLNHKFHMTIYQDAQRKHLDELIRKLRYRTQHYLHSYMMSMRKMRFAQDEHRKIIESCRKRDAKNAGRLMFDHVLNAGRGIITYLEQSKVESLP